MTLSLYEGRRYDPSHFMKMATAMNVFAAVAVLLAWQFTGVFFADPISAATTDALSATSRPGFLETPYLYLWLSPLAASFVGWIAYKLEYKTFGRFVIIYPALLYIGSAIWYHNYYV